MKADKDGWPAFPCTIEKECEMPELSGHKYPHAVSGMSLRDYAIVHFMAALIAKDEFDWESRKLQCDNGSCVPIIIATEQADAMLAARAKGTK